MSIFPVGHFEANTTVLIGPSCVSFLHEGEHLPILKGGEEKSLSELLLTHLILGLAMEMS